MQTINTEFGEIPNTWDVKKVKDIGRVVTGKTPPTKEPDFYGKEFLFVRIPDMGRSVRIKESSVMLSKKGAECISSSRLPPDSVMVSCIATIGNIGITSQDSFTNQQINTVIPNPKVIIPEWIYYFFKLHTDYLESLGGGGSVYTNISKGKFENAIIAVPPLPEQRAIVKILNDLDAKIELNQQMNKTLEAMAQALFKRWFVDFKFPGYEKVKFIDGLPEGWRMGMLSDVCEIIMGQSPPGETYNESGDGLPFYQGNRDFGYRFPTARVFCSAPTRFAETGDVLISIRAPVGALNIAHERCCIGRGVAALRMKNHSNGFLFCFLATQNDLWNRFNSEGTVFGCLNKTEFNKIYLAIPSEKTLRMFDEFVIPVEKMAWENEQEIRHLSNIRNSTLPRLMTGNIAVGASQ